MNMPKIIIRLNVVSFEKSVKDSICKNILKHMKKIAQNIEIKIANETKRWGEPGCREVIIHILSSETFLVNEVAALFDLSWKFYSSEARVSRNGISCEFDISEAMWDKRFDNKIFLHEDVRWVLIEDCHFDLDEEYD